MVKMLYNPFEMILEAIERVYSIDATLIFCSKEDCDENWGFTQKNDDDTFIIGINSEIPLENSLEIIAHEAAHIMAKSHDKAEGEEHDEEWEMWLDNIQREYMNIYEREIKKESADNTRKEIRERGKKA